VDLGVSITEIYSRIPWELVVYPTLWEPLTHLITRSE